MSAAAPNLPARTSARARPGAPRRGVGMLRPFRCAGKSGRRPNRRRSRGDGTLLLTVFVYVGIAVVVAALGRHPRPEGLLRRGPGAAVDPRLGGLGGDEALRHGPVHRDPPVGHAAGAHHRPPVRLVLDDPGAARRRGRALRLLVRRLVLPRRARRSPRPRRPGGVRRRHARPGVADNLFLLFLFWELTSVTSFLLIGTDDRPATARAAAQQALLITGAGGLAMLAGLVLIGQAGGHLLAVARILAPPADAAPPSTVGARARADRRASPSRPRFPFHSWLPGAMARPHARQRLPALGHHGEGRRRTWSPASRPRFAAVGPWRPIVVGRRPRSPWCSAATAPCASTTSSCSSPSARSASSASWWSSSASGHRSATFAGVRRCCSPTPCSRPRCSWSSASSTTRPTPATCARSTGSAGGCP